MLSKSADKHSYIYYKKYIEPSASKNLQNELEEAFFTEDWHEMERLLNIGALINYRYDDACGQTLLFFCNTRNAIIKLVELGADVNAKDKNGQSVIGNAIRRCWPLDLIKLLLKFGAQVNVQGPFGYSPLGIAVVHHAKNLELIQLLMAYKANVNGTDKYNKHKPLGDAMTDRNCMKILIKYGVLQNVENECKKCLNRDREKSNMGGHTAVDDFLEACVEEKKRMRNTILDNKCSLYEYLNRNCRSQGSFRLKIDVSEFPIYGDFINETIQKVKSRKDLLRNLDEVRIHATSKQGTIKLNYDSTFEIAAYLDNEDLQNLVEAFN